MYKELPQVGESVTDAEVFEGDFIMKVSTNGHCDQPLQNAATERLPGYFRRKAWPTRALGAVMLVIASPVILLLVVLVRLTSAGPGIYRQVRSGLNGKEFEMYKLRTMYADAETVSGPVWCKPGDSRITPLGKLLRLLHLDELPQLINVARGEMDLIGPRPERPVFVGRLAREIPNYAARLQVLPGVTGLAQINLPPDETMDCVRKKLVLDCAYIRDASLFLDLRILACTCLRMFGIRHGHAALWMGVRRHVQLPAEVEPRPAVKPPKIMATRYAATVANGNGNHTNGDLETCVALDTAVDDMDESPSDAEIDTGAHIGAIFAPRPR